MVELELGLRDVLSLQLQTNIKMTEEEASVWMSALKHANPRKQHVVSWALARSSRENAVVL